MTTVQDICWMAGLLEGEGCFFARENAATPRIGFDTTDQDIAERAAVLLGTTVRERAPSAKAHYKQVYIVRVGTARAVGWMMTIYPLMGVRRRARIRALLAKWRIPTIKGWAARWSKDRRCRNGQHALPAGFRGLCGPCRSEAVRRKLQKQRVRRVEAWHEGVR